MNDGHNEQIRAPLSPNGENIEVNTIPQSNSGQPQPNSGQPQPNSGQPQPNSEQPQPNSGQPQPNSGQPQPNSGQPQPNSGQPQPNSGQPQPNSGQPQPNSGQPQPQPQPQPNIGQPQPQPNDEQAENLNQNELNVKICICKICCESCSEDIMYGFTLLGRLIMTLYSFQALFLLYNFILNFIFLLPGMLYYTDNLGIIITVIIIYVFFAALCSCMLIIPTYEFLLFTFLRYKNVLAHLESIKIVINILHNINAERRINYKKSKIYIDILLI